MGVFQVKLTIMDMAELCYNGQVTNLLIPIKVVLKILKMFILQVPTMTHFVWGMSSHAIIYLSEVKVSENW